MIAKSSRTAALATIAEASYVYFNQLKGNYSDSLVRSLLQSRSDKGNFTPAQADAFVREWVVIAHQANTASGYSSTLFHSKADPTEFVLALRGTEPILLDGAADVGDIVTDGLAIDQIVDMYNEWQRLKTPAGTAYKAAYLETLPAETAGYAAAKLGSFVDTFNLGAQAYLAYLRSRSDLVIDEPAGLVRKVAFADSDALFGADAQRKFGAGALPANASVTVTGHSLGGHLAAAFTRLFPELNATAVTINGAGYPTGIVPGLGGNAASNISHLFKSLGGADGFSSGQIINVFGSIAPEFVTMNSPNGLVQQGTHVALTTEDPSLANAIGHGSQQMTDAAAVHDLFFRLDPSLAGKPIADALAVVAPVVAAGSVNPLGRFERAVDALGELLLAGHPSLGAADNERTDALYAYIGELRDAIDRSPATLVPLVGSKASDPRSLARADDATGLAARYALSRLNPFVAAGLDYSRFDDSQQLERYDASTGKGMLSDRWIDDRAAFLQWKGAAAMSGGRALKSDRIETYVFEDLSPSMGAPLTVGGRQNTTSSPSKVVFGSALADSIVGSDLYVGDRLYGMEGDDQIDARGGNDMVEGGRGLDVVHGGEGSDQIFGGNGKDQLYGDDDADVIEGEYEADIIEGGGGRDLLRGGAGDDELSGGSEDDDLNGGADSDVLDGGRGNDRLVGGEGDDSYRFHLGDGSDVVEDSDGKGRIVIDDRVIGSAKWLAPNLWSESIAGSDLRYAFSPDATGRGNLFITSHAGAVTVKNFKSGDLGIVLGPPGPEPVEIPVPTSTIMGTAGDDNRSSGPRYALIGTNAGESLQGLAGRDEVLAWGGDDVLEGGAGFDVLTADRGNDAVFADSALNGPSLRDYIAASAVAATAGAMPARLLVSGSEWLRGGLGDDTVVGGATSDIVFGGGGEDLLIGGAGHDLINGDDDFEPGNLTTAYAQPGVGAGAPFNAWYSPVIVHEFALDVGAADEIHAGSGDDAVYGELGADVIWGDDGNDTMSGGEDDDVLAGGNGNDRLAGDDYGQLIGSTVSTPVGDDYIDGGNGNDVLFGDGGVDTLLGGAGDDVIRGNNDIVEDGLTTTAAQDGDDYLAGGAGNDTLTGDSGSDTMLGDAGNDAMFGDSIYTPVAYQGDDDLDGGEGDDYLRGYAGADTLLGGEGNDTLAGDDGDDYLDVGPDVGGVRTVNSAYGGNGDDILVGAQGQQNYLLGEDGDDQITGEGHVWGGAGNDTLVVRGTYVDLVATQSVVQGGDGDDVIRLPNGGVSAYGEGGNDAMEGGSGVSFMSAGDGDDVVAGGTGADYAWGQAGADVLGGDADNDQLAGGSGDDQLDGGVGDDVLFGDDGNDTLRGGPGKDYLAGGAGDDRYLVDADEEQLTIADGSGTDVVEFGEGVSRDDLAFSVATDPLGNDQHLVIAGLALGGKITIVNGLAGAIAEYRFADGTSLTAADVRARATSAGAPPVTPLLAQTATIAGSADDDDIAVTSTAAAIAAGYGNDTVTGGAFDDTLEGSYGNDRLVGGGGRNQLTGGDGQDTYVVGLADAGTRIIERRATSGPGSETDVVEFGAGVVAAQTRLIRDGDNLVIALNGGPAQLTVAGYYSTSVPVAGGGTQYLDCKVERMQFADGTVWDSGQIQARIEQGAANAMTGTAGNDTFVVDSNLDTVTETATGGDDTVQSSVSFGLPAYVERLVLTGILDASAWANPTNAISYLTGNAGNNVFNGPGGPSHSATGGYLNAATVMTGGLGDDTYYLDYYKGGTVIENPGEGNDTIILTHGAGNYVLPPNVENAIDVNGAWNTTVDGIFTITGNELDNVLGYRGSAVGHVPYVIDGGAGADTMQGSFDDDVYIVDNVLDRVVEPGVYGGGAQASAHDEIRSSVSYGAPDNVEYLTLRGTDAIEAHGNGLGNRLDATQNAAANRLFGGIGDDYYIVNGNDVVVERAGEGRDTVEFRGTGTRTYAASDAPVNVEAIALGDDTGASDLSGDAGDNGLIGNASVNVLAGGDGDDTLAAGAGDDILSGDGGDDSLRGESGQDTYRFAVGFGHDTLDDASGTSPNALVFDASVARGDVAFDAGKLTLRSTGDSVALGKASTYSSRIDGTPAYATFYGTAAFADGSRIEAAELTARVVASFSHTATVFADGLEGTAGDDTLDGGQGTDVIDGMGGNDTLIGGDHGDWLFGGAGADALAGDADADQLAGGDGADRLAGGTGNDVLRGDAGDDALAGDDGDDDLSGDTGGDRLSGGAGRDTLQGGADDDVLDGGDDADVLHGDAGNDRLEGAADVDVLYGDAGDDTLDGGLGTDTLYGGGGDDTLRAGNGDASTDRNTLMGGEGNDVLEGSDGDDTLAGETGDDILDGGAGNDWLYDDSGNNVLRGGDGWDTLRSFAGNDLLDGGSGDDTLFGGAGVDTYVLKSGNAVDVVGESFLDGDLTIVAVDAGLSPADVRIARASDDDGEYVSISANAGADELKLRYLGADLPVELRFADGTVWTPARIADLLYLREGTLGADVLTGSAGNDRLFGFAGADTLSGLGGDDLLDGGADADTLAGDTGNDVYVVDDAGDVVTEAAGGGLDLVNASIAYVLPANVEDLTLSGTASSATGNALDNRLAGNTANNVLDGKAGRDAMVGALGDDTYVVDNAGDAVTERPGEGIDTVQSAIAYTLAADVENLTLTGAAAIAGTGNAAANLLTGNAAANTLVGNGGDDRLDGGAGADALKGGAGNDTYIVDSASDVVTELAGEGTDAVQASVTCTLAANVERLTLTGSGAIGGTGNALDNTIVGNAAANTLNGGTGADAMSGGAGNDTYIVDNVADAVVEKAGEGTDAVQSGVSFTLGANLESLTLTGTGAINGTGNALANALTGNAGNNVLDGAAGSDTLRGGAGNDTYVVDSTGDVVTEVAAEGTDLVQSAVSLVLAANVENLTLTGTAATNATGNALANVLVGNASNNILDGGAGSDTLKGGAGNDVYVVDVGTDVVTELANEGSDTVQTALAHVLGANVENLTLTGTLAVNGTGNALANTLTGNAADNLLDGAAGGDSLAGGAGNDTYVVDNALDLVTETAGAGFDAVNAAIAYVLPANVEQLTLTGVAAVNGSGNALDNALRGNTAANALTGLDGNDTLWGDLGSDALNGSNGIDLLQGGGDNDALVDTAGNDLLDGGAGTDALTGGTGRDMLVGGRGADTLTTGGGADIIAFNKGDGADLVAESVGTDDTLTLGGGLAYGDLKLRRSGLDLVLDAGNGDQLTFRNWYQSGVNNKSVLNLQIVADAMAAFNPAGADPLLNRKVVGFSFTNIVGQFDAALAANPALTSWNVSNALASAYLSGSDTAALGGDLAYDYGHRNAFSGIGAGAAQAVLGNAGFATTAQALQAASTLYAGTVRLN